MPETEVTPRNDWRSVAFCRALPFMNGPKPRAVPHTAMAEIKKLTTAAPAVSNRIAPQSTKGKTPNANMPARINPSRGSKITNALPAAPSNRHANSNPRRSSRIDISLVKVSTSGVTINTPMASPNHHISHADAKPDQAFTPVRNKTPAPTVALTAVPQRAPRMLIPSTSRSRVREG